MKSVSTYVVIGFLIFQLVSCEQEVSVTPPTTPEPIGYIYIESDPPGAKIYENGKNSGKYTPNSLSLNS